MNTLPDIIRTDVMLTLYGIVPPNDWSHNAQVRFSGKSRTGISVDASFYEYTARYDLHCVMWNLCITDPQHGVGLQNGGIRCD